MFFKLTIITILCYWACTNDSHSEASLTSTPEAYLDPKALIQTLLKLRTTTDSLPNIAKLCAASLVIPVSNAEVERVLSEVKRLRTDIRNRLQIDTVNQLMNIYRNDRHLNFVSAVHRYLTMKPRRVWRVRVMWLY